MWPFDPSQYSGDAATSPFRAGNLVLTPPPGVLKVSANYKPQLMKYYANQNGVPPGTPGAIPIPRFFIKDPWGNIYLMQASDYSTIEETAAAFEAAILPLGWTKQTRALDKDFVLHPSQSPANAFEFTLVRDNQNNTYNQIYWSDNGNLVSTQIQESGMPIWGGRKENVITITKSFDNLIYGGGGVTAFVFSNSLTAGTNTIADFNPYLGDTLNFNGQSYLTLITPYGIQLKLSNGASVLLEGVRANEIRRIF